MRSATRSVTSQAADSAVARPGEDKHFDKASVSFELELPEQPPRMPRTLGIFRS